MFNVVGAVYGVVVLVLVALFFVVFDAVGQIY